MSYRGFHGMSVDSLDGYDSTPYSGGYDLSLTYGRPLQPSDEICYPVSLPGAGDVDLERIHHSYGSQPSAFETENAKNSDCYGLLRPGFQFQPQPVSNTGYPDYGHQSYGHGSVYCGRPQHQFRADLGESERKPQYESGGYGREGSRYDQGLETELWTDEAGVKPPQYGFGEQNQNIGYRKPSYYEGEGYGHSIYGNNPEHVEKKHSHHHRHY